MSQKSSIGWTDSTWNPVRGCSKVSAGCRNCYAETFAERWRGIPGHPFEQGFDVRLVPEALMKPVTWKKPRRIFVNSMSDLFHKLVPFEYILQAWDVMACTRQHTYQILTKRPERMLEFFEWAKTQEHWAGIGVLSNVWLGVSVEDQRAADERIPILLQIPAAVRFLSCEPLLGPITFRWAKWMKMPSRPDGSTNHLDGLRGISWVIVGGESGRGARPCALEWIESLVSQCQQAGVPAFVKQLGAFCVSEDRWVAKEDAKILGAHPDGWTWRAGHPKGDAKGENWDNWPEHLRVREFPAA